MRRRFIIDHPQPTSRPSLPWGATERMGGLGPKMATTLLQPRLRRPKSFLRRPKSFLRRMGKQGMGFDLSSIPEAGTGQDATKAVAKVLAGTKGWIRISGNCLACRTSLHGIAKMKIGLTCNHLVSYRYVPV